MVVLDQDATGNDQANVALASSFVQVDKFS
jgi:hypothetical protein